MTTQKAKQNTSSKGSEDYFDRAWNLLKSMKFAILILLILAIASVVNLFANEFIVPAGGDAVRANAVYHQAYGDFRANTLMFFQMYSPYRSWWYTTLLGLLTLSLVVCIIDRAGLVWRLSFRPRFTRDRQDVLVHPVSTEVRGANLVETFTASLSKHGYKVYQETDGEQTYLDAERFPWAHSGAWLVHVGFVLLVIGGAMIGRGEYRTSAGGFPGQMLSADESQWGFNVRVDDFIIEYYPLGEGQYVEIDGSIIGRITAENADGTFDVEAFSPRHEFMNHLPADRIRNSFDRRMGGGRLDQPNISDYIAILTVIDDGQEVMTRRVEVNYPLRYKGYRFYQSSFDDTRRDAQGHWMTILNVRRDPGAPAVWGGIGLVSLGLVIGLYFVPKRVFGVVTKENGKDLLALTATSGRGTALLKEEFEKLVKELNSGNQG